MRRMTPFIILSALTCLLSLAQAKQKVTFTPAKKECFEITAPSPYKYCIHMPAEGKTNGTLAYAFHGMGLSEQTWNDDEYYTAQVQAYWQSKKIKPPTVVTVSFGPSWLLAPKGAKQLSGLAEVFKNEVMKEVESKLGKGKPKKRILFGESMGGLNSLMISLQYPQLFDKVASICPVIYLASPFDSEKTIQDIIARTGAEPKAIDRILVRAREYFADDKEWQKGNPLSLIETVDVKKTPKYYLSCGLYDAYGNYEGNERLVKRAQERGLKLDWHPLYGAHCVTDITSLAEFIAK